MSIRRVQREYEARLKPITDSSSPKASGKIEWKDYGNGETGLKLRAKGLAALDGTTVELLIGDAPSGNATSRKGKAELTLNSNDGDMVPQVAEYDPVELRIDGAAILGGMLVPD